MRILYLAHRVPYPPNRGDRIRSFHWLEYLGRRAEVHLAFLADQAPPESTLAALGRFCARVQAFPVSTLRRWLRGIRSFAAGRTVTEGCFSCPDLRHTLDAWARQTRLDAVIVYCSSMGQYLAAHGLADVPALVDLVDVDSQKWFDYAQHTTGPMRLVFQAEGRRLRRCEIALADRVSAVTLVSQAEAELYRSFCPAEHVWVVGNGVDLEYFRPVERASGGERPSCVFVGALDYRANVDGAAWFVRHVWPEVLTRRPEARFRLVGSRPGVSARRLARQPGVELVGEVPDVRPYLAEASVVVVPLRVARGVQNKVLEALGMGKAVIASPQALEGLQLEPGRHVCRAQTPNEWIDSILHLLDAPQLCQRLGQAGRQQVQRQYTWEAQLAPLAELLGLGHPEHVPA